MSELIGKDQSFVAKVERGVRRIDAVEFLVITRVLKADAFTILRRVEREFDRAVGAGYSPARGAK